MSQTNPFELIYDKLDAINIKLDSVIQLPHIPKIEIIDRKELCKRLDISEPTATKWGKKGKIPFFKIGTAVRYNWIKVIESLEKKQR